MRVNAKHPSGRLLVFVLTALASVAAFLCAVAVAQTRPAVPSPADQVTQLLSGFQNDDFRKIFETAAVYQMHIAELRRQNPQIMWQRLTDEYYDAQRAEFQKAPAADSGGVIGSLLGSIATAVDATSSSAEDPSRSGLRTLMRANPVWKILETRRLQSERNPWSGAVVPFSQVYVQLNYQDARRAPIFKEGLLKEAILDVRVETGSSLFWSSGVVPKSEAYWSDPPFRVLSVQWQTTSGAGLGAFNTLVSYNVIGGAPPYRSSTLCANMNLESMEGSRLWPPQQAGLQGSPLESPKPHITVELALQWRGSRVSFPLNCIATITDARNARDSVRFAVPRAHTNWWQAFCWIRQPWHGWAQGRPIPRGGCSELAELGEATAAIASPSPTPHPPVGEPTAASTKTGQDGVRQDIIRAYNRFLEVTRGAYRVMDSSRLAEVAEGKALLSLTRALANARQAGTTSIEGSARDLAFGEITITERDGTRTATFQVTRLVTRKVETHGAATMPVKDKSQMTEYTMVSREGQGWLVATLAPFAYAW